MARPKKSAATAAEKTRRQYSPAFREEALKHAAVTIRVPPGDVSMLAAGPRIPARGTAA